MRTLLLTAFILTLSANLAFSQNARVKQYTTPLAGQVILKDVDDKYNAQVYNLEMPDPDAGDDIARLHALKEESKTLYPYRRDITSFRKTSVAKPIVATSFVADSFPGIPPDNYMAINNKDSAISVINSTIAISNASTGKIYTRKSLISFSSTVGLVNPLKNDYRYDPKVIYDPEADRFICIMLNSLNEENYIVIGFSKSNKPDSTWSFYKFYGNYAGDTTWFDYPALAITQDELFFTGNKIKFDSTWQAGFQQTLIYQVRKQDGYNGAATLHYQIWDSVMYGGKAIRNMYPVKGGGSLKGPSQYFLSNKDFDISNDSIFLIKIPDTIGSSSNVLTVKAIKASTPYGLPPDGRQPDTLYPLATNDGRILGGYLEGNEIQFVSTSVNPANGSSAVYHGKITNFDSPSPTLQAQIFGIDTLDFGYPNISFTGTQSGNNQSIISFDYSGPHTHPGYGAIFYDGSNYSDMLSIMTGDSSIEKLGVGEQRWGDYSGSQPQWNAIGNVWVEGIYGRHDHNYGNYMAKLTSPFYTNVPVQQVVSQPSVLYPNPAWQYMQLQFGIDKDEVVNFTIYNMQGQTVDKILSTYCKEGQNIIQFNVAPLAPGTYFLKGMNVSGSVVFTNRFVRQ
ncbi:MAG TPA: T9SS type A sorting domain-containing protein [Flavipsychrobacter sp.]|nr:T9SS type A sorting domain-containing protein [Flavipsychrobacter sp.]